jgi:hypothetical protein
MAMLTVYQSRGRSRRTLPPDAPPHAEAFTTIRGQGVPRGRRTHQWNRFRALLIRCELYVGGLCQLAQALIAFRTLRSSARRSQDPSATQSQR